MASPRNALDIPPALAGLEQGFRAQLTMLPQSYLAVKASTMSLSALAACASIVGGFCFFLTLNIVRSVPCGRIECQLWVSGRSHQSQSPRPSFRSMSALSYLATRAMLIAVRVPAECALYSSQLCLGWVCRRLSACIRRQPWHGG